MTTIISNGSRWNGQEPDTIDELIEVLKTETIEERFFSRYCINRYGPPPLHYANFCPIKKHEKEEGQMVFFGNFEQLSHVFNIVTDDPEVIAKLKKAIQANEGWKKYYWKNLVNKDGSLKYPDGILIKEL